MNTLLQDVRYAFHSFRKNIGFTAAVVLTLALGATTVVLSIVDHVVLRPLAVAHADRLVLGRAFGHELALRVRSASR